MAVNVLKRVLYFCRVLNVKETYTQIRITEDIYIYIYIYIHTHTHTHLLTDFFYVHVTVQRITFLF